MSSIVRLAILSVLLLVLDISSSEAGTITTWHWSGPVTGYAFSPFGCAPGSDCGPSLESVVPLGTTIDVFMSFDLTLAPPNPSSPCYRGTASTSFQVLGQTYTGTGHVWDEGYGFGPGVCVPGYNVIEVVVPSWGSSGPELAAGWVPFGAFSLPGLWWAGDLTTIQPSSIASQFPAFYKPSQSLPQRFNANLQAVPENVQPVPEPTTWVLFGTGLAAAAWRRSRRQQPRDC